MRKEYDLTKAKRAKDVPHLAKLQAEASIGKNRELIALLEERSRETKRVPLSEAKRRLGLD